MFYLKMFGALVIGLYLGLKINLDLVGVNMDYFPPPEGFDWTDAEATKIYLSSLPASAFVLVILAHLGQAFFGGWLAARLAPGYPMRMAMTIGVLSMIGGILNQMIDPPSLLDLGRNTFLSHRRLWSRDIGREEEKRKIHC